MDVEKVVKLGLRNRDNRVTIAVNQETGTKVVNKLVLIVCIYYNSIKGKTKLKLVARKWGY